MVRQRLISVTLTVAILVGQLASAPPAIAGPNTGPGAFATAIAQELQRLGLSSSSGSTVITAANGTAAAPAYSYAANTDRGEFNDTGNSALGWSVGGTERAFLSASSLTCAVKQTWTTGLSLSTTTGHQVGPTDDDFATLAGDARKLLLNSKNVATDVVPAISILAGQSSWAQATVNTGGANLVLAGGIGRRFYAFSGVVGNIAGKTFTITVNGTAVVLTEGTDFARGASMTTAATAFAAAVNANGTLGPLVTATASSTTVYVQAKPTCWNLQVTDNQLADVPVTQAADGAIVLSCAGTAGNWGTPIYLTANNSSTLTLGTTANNNQANLSCSAITGNNVYSSGVEVAASGIFQFSSVGSSSGTPDAGFCRQGAAGLIGLLNPNSSTSPTQFRVYGTTDQTAGGAPTNAEWFEVISAAGAYTVGTNKSGTGTARAVNLNAGGTNCLTLNTSGTVSTASSVLCSGNFALASGGAYYWTASSAGAAADTRMIRGGGAGIITLDDNASGFARLCLGGTTSSYPAIKRNAATFDFRLADDTNYANVQAADIQAQSGATAKIRMAASLPAFQVSSDTSLGWSSTTAATGANDSSITRVGAAVVGVFGSGTTAGAALRIDGTGTANGQTLKIDSATELLTLSTSGTTTDTAGNLLPAGAIILSVNGRVTTTITTATSWQLGDATTAGRFTTANSTMTAGATSIGLEQHGGSGAAGAKQNAAAKVRVTTVGTPGAGVIRITVHYIVLGAATS